MKFFRPRALCARGRKPGGTGTRNVGHNRDRLGILAVHGLPYNISPRRLRTRRNLIGTRKSGKHLNGHGGRRKSLAVHKAMRNIKLIIRQKPSTSRRNAFKRFGGLFFLGGQPILRLFSTLLSASSTPLLRLKSCCTWKKNNLQIFNRICIWMQNRNG